MYFLDSLILSGILRKKVTDKTTYRLNRPIQLFFPAALMQRLSRIYQKDYERGGVLELAAVGSELQALDFIEVPNRAGNSTSYDPDPAKFLGAYSETLTKGRLPIALHTHPTEIGFHRYDTKNERFYIRPSRPDRQIANAGTLDILEMPEAIFVADSRFTFGYELSLYSGTVFPQSITALSGGQWAAVAGVGLFSVSKKNYSLVLLFLLWFIFEFYRRPQYQYSADGLRVKLSF